MQMQNAPQKCNLRLIYEWRGILKIVSMIFRKTNRFHGPKEGPQPSISRWLFLLSTLTSVSFFYISVNTGKLHVHTKVPDPFIFGSSADLYCNYSWDTADTLGTQGQPLHRKIYSLKWYKGHEEFFRCAKLNSILTSASKMFSRPSSSRLSN